MNVVSGSWRLARRVCVATLLAEAGLLAALYLRADFTRGDAVEMLAVARDVDLDTMWRELNAAARPIAVEQISYAELQRARAEFSLDMDLREMSADKGLLDTRQLEVHMDQDRGQYDALKASFDARLERLRQGALDESMLDVQRNIESIDSKLAKDQILRILRDKRLDPKESTYFVVTMFKNMPLDKRKKIISEFKTDEELRQLHDILDYIGQGVPEVDLVRDTRRELEAFNLRTK